MQLRATFKALYTIIFYDHRKNVEQLLREYDSVVPPQDRQGGNKFVIHHYAPLTKKKAVGRISPTF